MLVWHTAADMVLTGNKSIMAAEVIGRIKELQDQF